MKATAKAIMSVYKVWGNPDLYGIPEHRTNCRPDPKYADIVVSEQNDGGPIFKELLGKLQAKGVRPGTELKITVETIRPNKNRK